MQGCVRRCTKLHNPNWILGCIFKKIFRSVHPALVLFNKGLWNKNERKQKQQRTDSPFSIKGATHLMILMHINNHAKHIRTRQTNLPTSSRFPFVSWPCDPCPCYTNRDRQLLRELSRSVCQILPGAPRHDLWELRWIGYLQYWKCAMPVCSRGALQQLTVLAQNRENHRKHIWCFPKNSRTFSSVFFQMFKVSHVFHHLFPSFSPFLSSMFSLPPWNSPFQGRSRGETSPAQSFHGCVSGYTTRSRECCVLRKDPKGPKSVMWHILNHWTWLVT